MGMFPIVLAAAILVLGLLLAVVFLGTTPEKRWRLGYETASALHAKGNRMELQELIEDLWRMDPDFRLGVEQFLDEIHHPNRVRPE